MTFKLGCCYAGEIVENFQKKIICRCFHQHTVCYKQNSFQQHT